MAHVLTFLGGPYDGDMVTVSTVPKIHPAMEIAEPNGPPVPLGEHGYTAKVYAAQRDCDGRWWLVRQPGQVRA